MIDFNQEMIAPSTINPRVYKSVFVLSIQSDIDDTVTFGRFVKSNSERLLEEDEDQFEDEKQSFNITVDKHDKRQIELNLHFKNPTSISGGSNKDKISIRVLEVILFKSAKTLKTMQMTAFEEEDGVIVKSVPPIIDKDSAEKISSTTDTGGSILNLVSSSNFVVSLVMGGSM